MPKSTEPVVVASEAAVAFERAVDAECVRLAQMHGIDLEEVDRDFVAGRLADRVAS